MPNNGDTVYDAVHIYIVNKELNKTNFLTEYLHAKNLVAACEEYWSAYDLELESFSSWPSSKS